MKPALLRARWRSLVALLCGVLREIFDENAYQRFLARERLPRSPTSYACFCREREATRPRPRCC
jgi:hypothetical protein